MLVYYNLSPHKFWKKDYCKVVFALDFSVYHYVANFLDIITLIVRLIPLPLFNIAPTPRTEGFSRKMLGILDISRSIYVCYPYLNLVRKSSINYLMRMKIEDSSLLRYISKMPVLYLLGNDKNSKFHSE